MLPAVLMAALAALLLAPGLFVGPSLDPAVFVQVAGRLLDGDALYRDAWDHKPPGIYLLYAAGQAALPFLDPWLVAWLLSVAATAATGWLLVDTTRLLGVRRAIALGVGAAAVIAMSQYLTALGGGLTEPIAALPLAAALRLGLRPAGMGRLLAIGALLGVTLLVAIPLLPGVLAVAGYVTWRSGLRALPPGVLGAAVPAAGVAAWLSAVGALSAAVDAIVGYSATYRLTNEPAGWTLSAPVVTWTVLALLFLWAPALAGVAAGWRAGAERRALTVVALAWIGLSVGLFAYQGRFFAHYAIPLAIPLALVAALGIERLAGMSARLRGPAGRGLLLLPAALALVISAAAATAGGRMEWLPVARDDERTEHVAAAIRERTEPGDRIWVWGNEPQLYLAADRDAATPYGYLYPLVTPGYATDAMVADTAAALAADPPAIIVDAGSREPGVVGFQQLLIPRPLTSDGRDLDILDPLRELVRERYVEAATVDGWVIYDRRQP